MSEKTMMDKKLESLKEKVRANYAEVYANKPLLVGAGVAGALFVLSGTGIIGSALVGIGSGYVYQRFNS